MQSLGKPDHKGLLYAALSYISARDCASVTRISDDFMFFAGLTSLQKIGIALFLSCLGMGVAAIVEAKRLSIVKANQETPTSVFLLIPQFFLVGTGVGFMYTGQLDLFITQSPKGMKTMSTGLFLTTMALGFFFSSLLISIVKKVTTTNNNSGWVGESINKGRLDCFYGLLAILIFVDFGFYLLCASSYTSKIILENNSGSSSMKEIC